MTNPYSPPTAESLDGSGSQAERPGTHEFVLKAIGVVGANTIIPLLFARVVSNVNAQLGIAIGLAATALATIGLGVWVPRLQSALIRGGTVLAMFQPLPFAQFFAGVFAIWFCIKLGLAEDYNDDNPGGYLATATAGFVCTIITASLLAGCALFVGFLVTRGNKFSAVPDF